MKYTISVGTTMSFGKKYFNYHHVLWSEYRKYMCFKFCAYLRKNLNAWCIILYFFKKKMGHSNLKYILS